MFYYSKFIWDNVIIVICCQSYYVCSTYILSYCLYFSDADFCSRLAVNIICLHFKNCSVPFFLIISPVYFQRPLFYVCFNKPFVSWFALNNRKHHVIYVFHCI